MKEDANCAIQLLLEMMQLQAHLTQNAAAVKDLSY